MKNISLGVVLLVEAGIGILVYLFFSVLTMQSSPIPDGFDARSMINILIFSGTLQILLITILISAIGSITRKEHVRRQLWIIVTILAIFLIYYTFPAYIPY